jgi:hypothetical protein
MFCRLGVGVAITMVEKTQNMICDQLCGRSKLALDAKGNRLLNTRVY